MRIVFNNTKITIEYSLSEWGKLEEFYRKLGFEKYTTNNLFGKGVTKEVYRYGSRIRNTIASMLRDIYYRNGEYELHIIDDINQPLANMFNNRTLDFNIAILRIIPHCEDQKCVTEFNIDDDLYIPIPLITSIQQFFRDLIKDVFKQISDVRYRVRFAVEIYEVGQ